MRLVEDEEAVRNGSPADVAEGLDLEEAPLNELFIGFEGFLLAGAGRLLLLLCLLLLLAFRSVLAMGSLVKGHQDFEGVVDRLEPGVEFFLKGSREKSKGVAHGDHRTADSHAGVFLLIGEEEAPGDGHEGLSGAGLTVAGDQGDRWVEQCV